MAHWPKHITGHQWSPYGRHRQEHESREAWFTGGHQCHSLPQSFSSSRPHDSPGDERQTYKIAVADTLPNFDEALLNLKLRIPKLPIFPHLYLSILLLFYSPFLSLFFSFIQYFWGERVGGL